MNNKIPCGGFLVDSKQFEFKDGVLKSKGGAVGGGGLASLEGDASGPIQMMGHAITGAEKITTNGPAPVFIGSTIEPRGTAGAKLTATNAGELAAVKPESQDQYVPMFVGEPAVNSHAATRKYVDGVQKSLELQMPDKVGQYLVTPAGQAALQASAKPGPAGTPGKNGLDGNGIHVSNKSLTAQGSGQLVDLTGDNVKAGDVVLDADGVVYNIASVTDTQYTVGNEITKLIKPPVTNDLKLLTGASVVYGGKYYKTSDGVVDVTFEIALDTADLAGARNVIATLPTGYRPKHTVAAPATVQMKDGTRQAASIYCGVDGQITLSTNATVAQINRITSAFAFIVH